MLIALPERVNLTMAIQVRLLLRLTFFGKDLLLQSWMGMHGLEPHL